MIAETVTHTVRLTNDAGRLDRASLAAAGQDLRFSRAFVPGDTTLSAGHDDLFLLKVCVVHRWSATDRAWQPTGVVLDVDGQTPPCQYYNETGCG